LFGGEEKRKQFFFVESQKNKSSNKNALTATTLSSPYMREDAEHRKFQK
jgi:hypothetical protein